MNEALHGTTTAHVHGEDLRQVLEAAQRLVVVLDRGRVGKVGLVLHAREELLQEHIDVWLQNDGSALHRCLEHQRQTLMGVTDISVQLLCAPA